VDSTLCVHPRPNEQEVMVTQSVSIEFCMNVSRMLSVYDHRNENKQNIHYLGRKA
jgi:hypothetical protein